MRAIKGKNAECKWTGFEISHLKLDAPLDHDQFPRTRHQPYNRRSENRDLHAIDYCSGPSRMWEWGRGNRNSEVGDEGWRKFDNIDLLAKLGLDVETALLGKDEHVSVRVDERRVVHRLCGGVDVDGDALFECRITTSGDRLHAVYEVDLLRPVRDRERVPCELCWRNVDLGIEGREV
jgi:hypothetical protein